MGAPPADQALRILVGDFGDELRRAEKLDEPSHLYASLLRPSVVVTDIEHVAAGDRIERERNARLAAGPQFSPQAPFNLGDCGLCLAFRRSFC
jgi:hypothetical protein